MRPKRALTTERQSDPSHCRRILRKTAFQSCHQIDDRWRCDNLPGFDGQARQLGLDQRSQRLLIPVAVRARVKSSGAQSDDGARTSSAARNVNSAIPGPRGSTITSARAG